jgi:hypothetical protein
MLCLKEALAFHRDLHSNLWRCPLLPHRLLVAIGWVILAIINLGLYKYTGFWPSALLAAVAAGAGIAMLGGILGDLL